MMFIGDSRISKNDSGPTLVAKIGSAEYRLSNPEDPNNVIYMEHTSGEVFRKFGDRLGGIVADAYQRYDTVHKERERLSKENALPSALEEARRKEKEEFLRYKDELILCTFLGTCKQKGLEGAKEAYSSILSMYDEKERGRIRDILRELGSKVGYKGDIVNDLEEVKADYAEDIFGDKPVKGDGEVTLLMPGQSQAPAEKQQHFKMSRRDFEANPEKYKALLEELAQETPDTDFAQEKPAAPGRYLSSEGPRLTPGQVAAMTGGEISEDAQESLSTPGVGRQGGIDLGKTPKKGEPKIPRDAPIPVPDDFNIRVDLRATPKRGVPKIPDSTPFVRDEIPDTAEEFPSEEELTAAVEEAMKETSQAPVTSDSGCRPTNPLMPAVSADEVPVDIDEEGSLVPAEQGLEESIDAAYSVAAAPEAPSPEATEAALESGLVGVAGYPAEPEAADDLVEIDEKGAVSPVEDAAEEQLAEADESGKARPVKYSPRRISAKRSRRSKRLLRKEDDEEKPKVGAFRKWTGRLLLLAVLGWGAAYGIDKYTSAELPEKIRPVIDAPVDLIERGVDWIRNYF